MIPSFFKKHDSASRIRPMPTTDISADSVAMGGAGEGGGVQRRADQYMNGFTHDEPNSCAQKQK